MGLGGLAGSLTNIDPGTGLASMAWHGSPAMLSRDPYDCDYGVGFYGYAKEASAFVVPNPSAPAGLDCFRGTVARPGAAGGNATTVLPDDGFGRRFFLAGPGIDLELRTGTIAAVEIDRGGRGDDELAA